MRRESEHLPNSRLRLGLALVLGATLFGSLWAIADEGPKWAALAVTVGPAISLIPILLRVLPPLAKDAKTNKRDPEYVVTLLGLILYVAVVAGVLVPLDIEQDDGRLRAQGRRERRGRQLALVALAVEPSPAACESDSIRGPAMRASRPRRPGEPRCVCSEEPVTPQGLAAVPGRGRFRA